MGYALEVLPARWSTEAVAPIDMTAGLVTIQLPIPVTWAPDAQSRCALTIGDELRDSYGMQIIPFTLKMHNATVHVARISPQVYLSREDFDKLATNTLAISDTCSRTRKEVAVAMDLPGLAHVDFV